MMTLQGKGVSNGVSCGPLRFFRRQDDPVTKEVRKDRAAEEARFMQAQQDCVRQLRDLTEKTRKEAGEDAAALFETHLMLAKDEDYTRAVYDTLEREACNAEYAVLTAGQQFAGMLASMDDEYMRARSDDMRDVSRRIIRSLRGWKEGGVEPSEPVILAADDLAPSEMVQLNRTKLLGLLTQGGSGSSHTAILARTMGIPAVCGLGDALREGLEGKICCMDGGTGEAVIEPDDSVRNAFLKKQREQAGYKAFLESMKGLENITPDGRRIRICCNVDSSDEVPAVLENDGQGIGLFRSEFLYLQLNDYPTEEALFEEYKEAALAMGGKRVVIRTLDIGADKQADFFHMAKEENPAMGMRAIRICLDRPEIFRTQLRAICRASAFGKVAVMFPMITSVWEVEECIAACESVKRQLRAEGTPYREDMEIGIMIETPASVFMADELAQRVDFFSVGTNDLTQYMLACDRQNNDLGRFFDPHHPAVVRALKTAADAAHRHGIWIGICGDLGEDPSMLQTFLDIGIDELSVPPASVLPLRDAVRRSRDTVSESKPAEQRPADFYF